MTIEWLTPLIFTSVVVLIIWRPGGVNEAFPATIGGLLVLGLGLITLADMKDIFNAIEGAATIDISTIIMSAVLYRAGVLQWFARKMIKKANGSGKRLFIYSLMLSFLMTMFFNSDGSILITTPILISLVKELQLTKQKALPILVGSALIATASSTPIAVSNIANLIALKMVGLDLNSYVQLMFVPSIVSIAITSLLLYVIFRRQLRFHYTLSLESNSVSVDSMLFKVGISTVIIVRIGFFVAAAVGFPPRTVCISRCDIYARTLRQT